MSEDMVRQSTPLLFVILALACGAEPVDPPRFEAGARAELPTFEDSLWDDGQAEIASYRAVERRYGTLREGRAVLIFVKESFDADSLVKADGRSTPRHALDVMKLNFMLEMPTGVYTYHQMASIFARRSDLALVKIVTGSQEWCGATSKQLVVRGGDVALRTSSYFGDEGERAHRLEFDERTVVEDALPLWLRALDLEREGARSIRLLSRQLDNRARPPRFSAARVLVEAPRELVVPAGTFEAIAVRVERDGDTPGETYFYERAAPHRLLRWERADGGHYELLWSQRAPYWQMNALEDVGALGPESRPDEEPIPSAAESVEAEPEPGVDADPPAVEEPADPIAPEETSGEDEE